MSYPLKDLEAGKKIGNWTTVSGKIVRNDKIDSSLGYTVDNIQILHVQVNWMKRDHTEEYFIELCKKIVEYSGGHNDIN